jgi:hypothetical protein
MDADEFPLKLFRKTLSLMLPVVITLLMIVIWRVEILDFREVNDARRQEEGWKKDSAADIHVSKKAPNHAIQYMLQEGGNGRDYGSIKQKKEKI